MSRPPFWRVPRNKTDDDFKVIAGSPSEGELRRGDTIVKIGDYNAKTLSHSEAHSIIKNAGNTISMVVQRGDQSGATKRAPTVGSPSIFQTPQTPKPPVTGGVPTPFSPSFSNQQPFASSTLPRSKPAYPSVASPQPIQTYPPPRTQAQSHLPVTVFPPPNPLLAQPPAPFPSKGIIDEDNYEEEMERMAITHQPYRTTPLVLPGAKVKKDLPSSSYLQLHPNPMMRAQPVHYDTSIETIMKQKVAGTVLERVVGPAAAANTQVVHKQFNSPIGLYSEHNIAETIANQTGVTPAPRPGPKDTIYFDPMKSETFKALQDEEGQLLEAQPTQLKVFTPPKPQEGPIRKCFAPHSTEDPTNTMGIPQEKIQQSYSFRRLMNDVLGESDF